MNIEPWINPLARTTRGSDPDPSVLHAVLHEVIPGLYFERLTPGESNRQAGSSKEGATRGTQHNQHMTSGNKIESIPCWLPFGKVQFVGYLAPKEAAGLLAASGSSFCSVVSGITSVRLQGVVVEHKFGLPTVSQGTSASIPIDGLDWFGV